MGTIVKGVASLFGGRARRREQKAANQEFETAKGKLGDHEWGDYYGGLEANQLDPSQAIQAQVGTLGDASQAKLGQLGDAQGYSAQGYTAGQTNVGGLLTGADTGLTNTMNNLQVSTAGADRAYRASDEALAASQDLAAQAGSGAGGATALLRQAAQSKEGISADIDRQVKANEAMRANAESQLQQGQLAQQNLASKFELGQQQFNVGEANMASRFGAQAANDAARFGAQSQNQFDLQRFGAENQMNQWNAGVNNQFGMAQFQAGNQFALQNAQTQNQFSLQNQQQMNNFMLQQAQGQQQLDENKWGQQMEMFNISAGRKGMADQARARATGDLIGGIAEAGNMAVKAIAQGSDRRLKKDIKLIGLSPKGLKIYNFKYKDISFGKGIFQGVMSDEIPSYAVVKHNDGYDRVDYNKIDVEFKSIK